MRRNSVALTRLQWVAAAIALAVAVVGLVITVVVQASIGILVTSVASLTAILVIGFGHARHDPRHDRS